MPNAAELLRRQKALGDFGDFVLDHDDLQMILDEGCRIVADALDADLAKVMEIERSRDTALVRAGVGWRDGIVGEERVSLSDASSEAFAIERGEPVITNDIAAEKRFHFPRFLKEHGVVALVNVPIFLPGRTAWGILQVDAREKRSFEEEDIQFLKTYSMVLGPVVDRLQKVAGLRESEARQGLLQTSWETAADGTIDADSPSWRAYTGQTLEEWLGYGWLDAVHPDDRAHAERQWRDAVAVRGLMDAEFRLRAPDGSWRWTNVRAAPVLDSEGRIEKWAGMNIDIDARKRAEEALRERDERQRFLLGLGDAMRAQSDPEAKIESAARHLGEHLQASRVLFAEHDRDRNRALIFNGWSADEAQPFPTTIKLEDYEGETLNELRNGRAVRIDNVGAGVGKPGYAAIADGGVQALLSVPLLVDGVLRVNLSIHQHEPRRWTDTEAELVSEVADRLWAEVVRGRSEKALRKSEERFRLAIEGSKIALYECDLDLRYTWVANPVPGFAPSDILGQTDDELLGEEDARRLIDFKRRALAAEAPLEEELEGSPGGERRQFLMRAEKLGNDASGEKGLRVLALDITEIKKAERALRKSEQRSRLLLAELQHRVRNILAMIRSIARRTGETTDTAEDYVQHLEGRISAMARTQALLTRDIGAEVDLQNLLLDELKTQAAQPEKYRIGGPDVALPPKAAEVLGLALHELATNSVKYGALSASDGRLDVRWALLNGDGKPRLSLVWSETGIDLAEDPRRRGFGTELITNRVPYELHGTGTLEFSPAGLVATIEFPLKDAASILQTDEGGSR